MKTKFGVNKDRLEFTMERVFDAPREKVWEAHVTPDILSQWWGPRKYKSTIEVLEPRVGGKWRFIHEADGKKHVFFGEFLEVSEPESLTWSFNYEPYPNTTIVETVSFEELPEDKTKLSVLSKYPSIEALEGMMQSGMEEGANETWDRLDEFLAKDERST